MPTVNELPLGTLFLNYIKSTDIGIAPIEKTSLGQQRYEGEIVMGIKK